MTICRFLRNRTGSGHAPCERLWPAGTINHSLVVAKINWLFRSGALPANQGYSGRAFDAGKISVKEDAKWRDGGDERQRVAEEQGAARRGIAHEELRAELAKAKRECKKGQVVVLGTDGRVVVGQPISSLDYATATSISQ